MKKSYKFITVNEMRHKLDSARFEFSWVFCNGVSDEPAENVGFKQYLKRIFLSNNSMTQKFSYALNKLHSNNSAGNIIKSRRKWILLEQL